VETQRASESFRLDLTIYAKVRTVDAQRGIVLAQRVAAVLAEDVLASPPAD
jgi:hypothetical protein